MKSQEYDLVVIGAAPGGLAAAIRCARGGLRVLVTTWTGHIGGMWCNGVQLFDTYFTGNRAPWMWEFWGRVKSYYLERYGPDSPEYLNTLFEDPPQGLKIPGFEPKVAERLLEEMVEAERGITIARRYYPVAVERAGRLLRAVHLEAFDDQESIRAVGHSFMDATYEGDLAALAGVPYRVGRESRWEYAEPHAGRIFWGIARREIMGESSGEGDHRLMSANCRMALSSDPNNRRSIQRPAGYDRDTYTPMLRTAEQNLGERYLLKSRFITEPLTPYIAGLEGSASCMRYGKRDKIYGWNAANLVGGCYEYPEADWPKRREIIQRHKEHALGLLYFIQHDEAVPPEVRGVASEFGLPLDEYTDNDNVPHEIYLREGRRIVGRHVFTEHDCMYAPGLQRTRVFDDSIATTDWYMDSHEVSADRVPGSCLEGMLNLHAETKPAQVPFRSLLPVDLDNLFCVYCISSTHMGFGCLRLEPTIAHICESAAHAVLLSRETGTPPGELPVETLQRRLVQNGIMLTRFDDFDMSLDAPWVPAVQYLGTKGFFPGYLARPLEPLTRSVAAAWARATGELIAERGDATERARMVAAAEAGYTGTDGVVTMAASGALARVTGAEFVRLLDRELSYHRGAELSTGTLIGGQGYTGTNTGTEESADSGASLSRGAACVLIFEALTT